jgi:putative heme iron utilization protein
MPIPDNVSDRICNHMNKDHKSEINSYATKAGLKDFKTVQMMRVTSEEMHLWVDGTIVHVKYPRIAEDAKDIKNILVEMSND